MPDVTKVATMVRFDMGRARQLWLASGGEPSTDFLLVKNHEGLVIGFHGFRQARGGRLALRGMHPKVIQTIMRHSAIELTMTTYGHTIASDEWNALDRLGEMVDSLSGSPKSAANSVRNYAKPC